MKFKNLLCTFVTLLSLYTTLVCGQITRPQNPSVSSMVRFEEYPVDLYTGTPRVRVPICNMPTRSKDVSINISLNYHPSSIAIQNKSVGDAGHGWNITSGGAVGRNIAGRPDEFTWANGSGPAETDDVYYFNFIGHTGKFKLIKTISHESGIVVTAEIIESNPAVNLMMDVTYTSLGVLTSATFYDDRGYTYLFNQPDRFIIVDNDEHKSYTASFQLTEIRDNNNNILVSYLYDNYEKYEEYHVGSDVDNYKFLKEINVPGFGKIVYNISGSSESLDNWFVYDGVTIYDYLDNPVRKFEFLYDIINNKTLLTQVDEGDYNGISKQSYKLFYKTRHFTSSTIWSTDEWGYPSNIIVGCDSDAPAFRLVDPVNCTGGVLEKMILPTGGCIIYEYEPNTYSYQNGYLINANYDDNGNFINFNPNLYADISDPNNIHNYTKTIIGSKNFSSSDPSALSFNVSQNNTKLYFHVNGNRYLQSGLENPNPGGSNYIYPQFILQLGTTILKYFNAGTSYENSENNCLGFSSNYDIGSYNLSMSNTNNTNGWAEVYTLLLKQNINKWYYGGGIRIKKIGFFANEDVPQDFYSLPAGSTTMMPANQTSYDYNFPSDAYMSSGSIYLHQQGHTDSVNYKYVTISESDNNGKTVNEFTSSIDHPANYYAVDDYRNGKLINQKIFDNLNVLQAETQYNFLDIPTFVIDDFYNPNMFVTGWMMPTETLTTQYLPSGNFITKTKFTYDELRRLIEKENLTSRSSQNLITKYYYHSGNSEYSSNRISEIEQVKEYVNTDLLSTSKTIYSNFWNNPQNTASVNVSYMPQQIQVAKESGVPETLTQVNLYDQFGHPLEIQQVNGLKKVYIWGYRNSQIIAEIENISYSDIAPTTLITEAQTASDTGNEAELLVKLDALRNAPVLADSFITTYTYKPLVGQLSVKDARGYKLTYEYDLNNNLKFVKDEQGNILSAKENHTKL